MFVIEEIEKFYIPSLAKDQKDWLRSNVTCVNINLLNNLTYLTMNLKTLLK